MSDIIHPRQLTTVVEAGLRQGLRRNWPRVAPKALKSLSPLILISESDGTLKIKTNVLNKNGG